MSIDTRDQVRTKQQQRIFIIRGGAGPGRAPAFYGTAGADYFAFTGAKIPLSGGYEPINVGDPRNLKEYKVAAMSTSAPDLAGGTLELLEPIGKPGFAWTSGLLCKLTKLIAGGNGCKDPSNLNQGWSTLEIWPDGKPVDIDGGDRSHFSDDDQVSTSINYVYPRRPYMLGEFVLAQAPTATLVRAVNDVVYGAVSRCTDCGPANDGATWLYGIMVGFTAIKPSLVYSTDGGATWATSEVTPAAVNELPVAVKWIPGRNSVFILSPQTNGAYYVADVNQMTGVPTGFIGVTTGFLASGAPTDVYIYNDQAFICGALGSIQRVAQWGADPTLLATVGANSWARIDGDDAGFIAVLASTNRIVGFSPNGGQNWATATTAPGAAGTGTALEVIDNQTLLVGLSNGEVYYTENRGETWTKISTGLSFTAISDIKFATREVGYIAGTLGGAQVVATTFDGGKSWSLTGSTNPHVSSVPASTGAFRRLALPDTQPVISANALAIAGTATGGTAGYVAAGKLA
jgi:hypothetical protein